MTKQETFKKLADLLERVGETYDPDRHEADFGLDLEDADYIADFFNNGGLEFQNDGLNFAVQYVAVKDGQVYIGTWVWEEDEDFDQDAEFIVYDESDNWEVGDVQRIYDAVQAVYGNE